MPAVDTYVRSNPRHRILVEYTAYGKSPKEIAEVTGFSEAYVKGIQRSPLFKSEVANAQQAISANTMRALAEKLAEQALPSLTTLTDIRDDTNARHADRITSADKILGRTLDLYAPRNGRNGDDEKRSIKIVVEGNDFRGLAEAIREVDGKGPIDVTPSAERHATPAPNNDYDNNDDGAIRAVSIEELSERGGGYEKEF